MPASAGGARSTTCRAPSPSSSFVAELAQELGRDHKELLLELIGPARKLDGPAMGMPDGFWNYGEKIEEYPIDTGRLANVLNVAADAAGYGQKLPRARASGWPCTAASSPTSPRRRG